MGGLGATSGIGGAGGLGGIGVGSIGTSGMGTTGIGSAGTIRTSSGIGGSIGGSTGLGNAIGNSAGMGTNSAIGDPRQTSSSVFSAYVDLKPQAPVSEPSKPAGQVQQVSSGIRRFILDKVCQTNIVNPFCNCWKRSFHWRRNVQLRICLDESGPNLTLKRFFQQICTQPSCKGEYLRITVM